MIAWATLAFAASCWPANVPVPADASAINVVRTVYQGAKGENVPVVVTLYSTETTFLAVAVVKGLTAMIDDNPSDDDDAIEWWIDPGVITDDTPPRVQPDPHQTCQWRRRTEKGKT